MQLAQFQIELISDGTMRLDGGAMFGVVPKVVWQKLAKPDEQNRILIGLNCLLVRTGQDNILIDTGIGDKWDARSRERYAICHPPDLLSSLAQHNLTANDITIVINTHLHFDHAGGNTRLSAGVPIATFPNARYLVQRREYQHACQPHERDRASYIAADWQPLIDSGQLELLDGNCEVVPGVSVFGATGHNLDTQLVRIDAAGQIVVFFADIVPTTAHLPYAWVMGYDLYPVDLIEQKKRLLPQAARENWICVFEHDALCPWARIVAVGDKFQPAPLPV